MSCASRGRSNSRTQVLAERTVAGVKCGCVATRPKPAAPTNGRRIEKADDSGKPASGDQAVRAAIATGPGSPAAARGAAEPGAGRQAHPGVCAGRLWQDDAGCRLAATGRASLHLALSRRRRQRSDPIPGLPGRRPGQDPRRLGAARREGAARASATIPPGGRGSSHQRDRRRRTGTGTRPGRLSHHLQPRYPRNFGLLARSPTPGDAPGACHPRRPTAAPGSPACSRTVGRTPGGRSALHRRRGRIFPQSGHEPRFDTPADCHPGSSH